MDFRRRRILATVAVVVLIAMVAGAFFLFFSGGVSKEEFIEKADAICSQKLEESSAIEQPTDLESTGNLFAGVTPILVAQTREIRALEAPDEDAAVLEDWLNTQDELVVVFRTAAEAAGSGDQEGFDAAFTDANAIQAQSSRLASQYGFDVCGIATPS